MPYIHVIHENDEWTGPLLERLAALGLPARSWHLAAGGIDLSAPPPEGIFYNRMSASSHTRGHRFSPEYAGAVLAWLERHGARVLNPSSALRLELSKVAQYMALDEAGIRRPRTRVTLGQDALVAAAAAMPGPFVTKHNRAGKGLGVRLFTDVNALREALAAGGPASPLEEPPVDGITLVQAYIQAATPRITRVELVGQELLYAVAVDTSEGFELCPADACELEVSACPASTDRPARFSIVGDFDHPLVPRYREFMRAHDLHVAAFEFIEDVAGRAYTYDINTNTNYNPAAEARAGRSGAGELAAYLGRELDRVTAARAA